MTHTIGERFCWTSEEGAHLLTSELLVHLTIALQASGMTYSEEDAVDTS